MPFSLAELRASGHVQDLLPPCRTRYRMVLGPHRAAGAGRPGVRRPCTAATAAATAAGPLSPPPPLPSSLSRQLLPESLPPSRCSPSASFPLPPLLSPPSRELRREVDPLATLRQRRRERLWPAALRRGAGGARSHARRAGRVTPHRGGPIKKRGWIGKDPRVSLFKIFWFQNAGFYSFEFRTLNFIQLLPHPPARDTVSMFPRPARSARRSGKVVAERTAASRL